MSGLMLQSIQIWPNPKKIGSAVRVLWVHHKHFFKSISIKRLHFV